MKERIDIFVDEKRLSENEEKQERLKSRANFGPVDRVPVIVTPDIETCLRARGSSFKNYFRTAADNFREQLLNKKWHIENYCDDSPVPLEEITLGPDLGGLRGLEFMTELEWPEDGLPVYKHPVTSEEQIDSLTVPEPWDGLHARKVEWFRQMRKLAEDYDLRLNGEKLRINVKTGLGGGPVPAAYGLCGDNFLMWMMAEPERTHKLMDIVTTSHIQCVRYFDELNGHKRTEKDAVGMGNDIAEMLSPDLFRQFVVPYCNRVYETLNGVRNFHMCGKIDHLLDIIRDELKIRSFNTFGFCTDIGLIREKLSGRMLLSGGPHPLYMHDGPEELIIGECLKYLNALGPRGGYALGVGGGIMAGTPPEHIKLMVEASKKAGPFA